eukprot:gnl/MRDRNA2_/MRDRNA2_34252_c0_seq2.p1 gnl/MRDRNA2_/MRDRNA2_34252_c0~~gnl/MRDRNA2_/MRDRNA2_34252_c0_seq2.p1  ORF type:complete len:463 (+),score=75.55 gnl/MRDRNA2_/MRDRNA2_34252_c0_seq2:216-1604(+)
MYFWWQLLFFASCMRMSCSSRVIPRHMSLGSTSIKAGRHGKQPEIRKMIEHEIEERLHEFKNGTTKSSGPAASVSTRITNSSVTTSDMGAADTEEEKPAGVTATQRPAAKSTAGKSTRPTTEEDALNFWKKRRRNVEKNEEGSERKAESHHSKNRSSSLHVQQRRSPVPNGTDRVLLFWAVGAEDRVINLVMQNVKHAREQLPSMDVYLAHYDSKQAIWKKKDAPWYNQNVDFSAEATGYKFQLMKKLLSGGPFSPDLDKYAWVWALDEDVDFTKTDLKRLFELADTSGALLGLPTFTELDGSGKNKKLNYPMQNPQDGCSYRYAPVVEVIFPFIRPDVLTALFKECNHCIHQKSVWGLDRMWCSWSARLFQWNPSRTCALIDETPVLHRNFKTLRGKYIVSGAREMQAGFMDMAMGDFKDVQKHHPKDFTEGAASTMQSSTCVMPLFRHTAHRKLRKLLRN